MPSQYSVSPDVSGGDLTLSATNRVYRSSTNMPSSFLVASASPRGRTLPHAGIMAWTICVLLSHAILTAAQCDPWVGKPCRHGSLGRNPGQRDTKGCALTLNTLHRDLPSMRRHNLLHNI